MVVLCIGGDCGGFYSDVGGYGCCVSGGYSYGGMSHVCGFDEFGSRGGIHGCNCRSESVS